MNLGPDELLVSPEIRAVRQHRPTRLEVSRRAHYGNLSITLVFISVN
jgi:hypothetical protein